MPEDDRWYDAEGGRELVRLLTAEGVSPWVEGLTREHLVRGDLRRAARTGLRGAVLDAADMVEDLRCGAAYRDQVDDLAVRHVPLRTAMRAVLVRDARTACDDLMEVHERTGGADGLVSLALHPALVDDPATALAEARAVHRAVDRPNLLVALPGTGRAPEVLQGCLARGVGAHAVGVYAPERHGRVLAACAAGMGEALEAGRAPGGLRALVSLCLAHLDQAAAGMPGAPGRSGSSSLGLAVARLAFRAHEERLSGREWAELTGRGAVPPRLMWYGRPSPDAGVSADHYVSAVVGWRTVTAVAPGAFVAAARGGRVGGDTLLGTHVQARAELARLAGGGADADAALGDLEERYTRSRVRRWERALEALSERMEEATAAAR
ncbi:transaldolase family protein [Nocardiopsis chromatogenes]|uniref:transaldolase family protein n=1 Tax=Nocardiopsis chromatogenes TaxID=280239 RepID=UPI000344FB43|nr:transaldolase family protein [Nocardiopsis chromatogenes]